MATNVVASRPPERQGSPATTIARAKMLRGNSRRSHTAVLLCYSHWNCQVLEDKDAAYTMDGFNRLFMETKVAKLIYSDKEGGLIGAFKQILWL